MISDLSLLAAPGTTTGVLSTALMATTLISEGSESQRPKLQLLLKSLALRVSPSLCHKVSVRVCVWNSLWQSLYKKRSFLGFLGFFKENVLCSKIKKFWEFAQTGVWKKCDMIGFYAEIPGNVQLKHFFSFIK